MNIKKDASENMIEILIVEDSPTQAEVLKYLLEQHGYTVLAATNGKQALAFLDNHEPALVISDIVMPEMDGYELCRQIKSANRKQDIPVILLTSLSNAEDVLDGLECGADNFITKPYNEEYLLMHVEQIIANRKLFRNERVRIGLEIMFGGKRRFVTADQQQMLTLLISTYEAAVRKNAELVKTQDMYKLLNERLEDMVKERTGALTEEVAERKRAEEVLKESEEKFKNVFDNSLIGKSITALDGSVNANPAFCRMLGYTIEELACQNWQNITHPDDRELTRKNLDQLLSGEKKSARFIKRYLKKDGSIVWADVGTVLQRDKNGSPLYFITSAIDITERKHAEDKIKQLNNELLQKNTELEQLIYVASHDLRSPLVNVQGFSKEMGILVNELAEITSQAGLPGKQQARLSDIVTKEFPEAQNYILASVIKMDALLKGLLKLSRLGRAALNFQQIDMDEMLSFVIKTVEYKIQQSGVRVEIAPLPRCSGDQDQVNQIFTNIIDNALKYLSPDRPGVILISGKTAEGGFSEYCIEDNGIGIAPQYIAKVFEIFHRLEPQMCEGEGLGLAIVKKIVSRLGGSIRLESELGKGSRFFVSLPGA